MIGLQVEWLDNIQKIESFREQWIELENSVHNRMVFGTYDYVISWYRHYSGEGDEQYGQPLVGLVRRGGKIIAIAPFTSWKGTFGGIPVRKIDLAGFNAEAGEFLVREDDVNAIALILEALYAEKNFDVLCLGGLDINSAKTRIIREFIGKNKLRSEVLEYRYAKVDLGEGYEKYCAMKGKNFRRNRKRQAEKYSRAGDTRVESYYGAECWEDISGPLSRMFSIYDASWKVREGGFLKEHHRQFYMELIKRFGKRFMIDLSILSLDSRDAAFILALVERGFYYDVTVSYDDNFKHLGPGYFLMDEVVEKLSSRGIRTVISHGDHPYKERWATEFIPQNRIFIFNHNVMSTLGYFMKFGIPMFLGRKKRTKSQATQ